MYDRLVLPVYLARPFFDDLDLSIKKGDFVYFDPPYGIKYGSNFQPFVNKRDVKDGKDDLILEDQTKRGLEIKETSVDVPPISNVSNLGLDCTISPLYWQPTMPPAGPDRIQRTASRRAASASLRNASASLRSTSSSRRVASSSSRISLSVVGRRSVMPFQQHKRRNGSLKV